MRFNFSWRIWILILFIAFSLIAIFGIPPSIMQKGVLITSVKSNSTAFDQGLRQGQIITEIDGKTINSLEDFTAAIKDKFFSAEKVKTSFVTNDGEFIIYSNETPEITVAKISKTNVKRRI